jgi:transposase
MRKWIYLNNEKSKYKISSKGYVVSTQYKGQQGVVKKLKHNHDHDGYCIITLNHKGKKYTRKIHRLVAEAFIENPLNLPQVNHKDGDKDNNDMSNLEWMSCIDNINHARENNLRYVKYNDEDINLVSDLIESNQYSMPEISEITGVSKSMVIRVKNKKRHLRLTDSRDFSGFNKTGYLVGSKNKTAKITEEDAKRIHEYLKNGYSMKIIAEMLGVSYSTVSKIKYKQAWTHVTNDDKK